MDRKKEDKDRKKEIKIGKNVSSERRSKTKKIKSLICKDKGFSP